MDRKKLSFFLYLIKFHFEIESMRWTKVHTKRKKQVTHATDKHTFLFKHISLFKSHLGLLVVVVFLSRSKKLSWNQVLFITIFSVVFFCASFPSFTLRVVCSPFKIFLIYTNSCKSFRSFFSLLRSLHVNFYSVFVLVLVLCDFINLDCDRISQTRRRVNRWRARSRKNLLCVWRQ